MRHLSSREFQQRSLRAGAELGLFRLLMRIHTGNWNWTTDAKELVGYLDELNDSISVTENALEGAESEDELTSYVSTVKVTSIEDTADLVRKSLTDELNANRRTELLDDLYTRLNDIFLVLDGSSVAA